MIERYQCEKVEPGSAPNETADTRVMLRPDERVSLYLVTRWRDVAVRYCTVRHDRSKE